MAKLVALEPAVVLSEGWGREVVEAEVV